MAGTGGGAVADDGGIGQVQIGEVCVNQVKKFEIAGESGKSGVAGCSTAGLCR